MNQHKNGFERKDTYLHIQNMLLHSMPHGSEVNVEHDLVDISARIDQKTYVFRIKLFLMEDAQESIGIGMSELYEFQYLQKLTGAILVLVIANPLPDHLFWMLRYLEQDRQIKLIWNGDSQLHASPQTREELAFLWDGGQS